MHNENAESVSFVLPSPRMFVQTSNHLCRMTIMKKNI